MKANTIKSDVKQLEMSKKPKLDLDCIDPIHAESQFSPVLGWMQKGAFNRWFMFLETWMKEKT